MSRLNGVPDPDQCESYEERIARPPTRAELFTFTDECDRLARSCIAVAEFLAAGPPSYMRSAQNDNVTRQKAYRKVWGTWVFFRHYFSAPENARYECNEEQHRSAVEVLLALADRLTGLIQALAPSGNVDKPDVAVITQRVFIPRVVCFDPASETQQPVDPNIQPGEWCTVGSGPPPRSPEQDAEFRARCGLLATQIRDARLLVEGEGKAALTQFDMALVVAERPIAIAPPGGIAIKVASGIATADPQPKSGPNYASIWELAGNGTKPGELVRALIGEDGPRSARSKRVIKRDIWGNGENDLPDDNAFRTALTRARESLTEWSDGMLRIVSKRGPDGMMFVVPVTLAPVAVPDIGAAAVTPAKRDKRA